MMKLFRRINQINARAGQKGFSYLEIIIATVVIVLVVPGLLVVMATMAHDAAGPEYAEISGFLAQEELDRIHTMAFGDVVAETSTSYTGDFSAYSYTVGVTTVPAGINTHCTTTSLCKQVTVTITDPAGSTTPAQTIVTIP